MTEALAVQVRETRGKRNARRMRQTGQTPAVLYGHGKEVISLTLPTEELKTIIRHGAKLVELKGGVSDSAIIRDMQWDALGSDVLHVDFVRVKAGERLEVEVTVELRGDAPGVNEGGVIQHLLHRVDVDVPVSAIPEKLHVNINTLQLDQTLTVADIEDLPADAKLLTAPDSVVVQCVTPAAEPDDEAVEGVSVEPEVIGRKEGDEEEGEGKS